MQLGGKEKLKIHSNPDREKRYSGWAKMKPNKTSWFYVLLMTWIAILMMSSVSVQAYDTVRLDSYARLSFQIRREMEVILYDLQNRIIDMSTLPSQVQTTITQLIADMNSVLSEDYWRVVNNAAALLKLNLAIAMKVQPTNPYTDNNALVYGQVDLDYGMGYSTSSGSVAINKAGVYMLDFKVQGVDYVGINTKINVFAADGTNRYDFFLYTDWEVIPFMYLLKLEAGDTFQTYEAVSSGTLASRFVTKADANQLSLRYLGEFVPLGFSTTAAVPVTTTPWWYG